MIAMIIMTIGLMSLVGVAAVGVQRVGQSSPMLIAREKAREAIESVHSARDTGELAWAKVRNAADGGVFLAGAPAEEVLVMVSSTVDDGAIETVRTAGSTESSQLGRRHTLWPITAIVLITPMFYEAATTNPNLRQIEVIVRYRVDAVWRTYTITTFISSYS